MISEVKEKFISTATLIDDASKLADKGNPLAKSIAANWEYPVDVMFLSPEGKFLSKLNSFKDFTDVQPGVSMPRRKDLPTGEAKRSHVEVFLDHVARHFATRDRL